MKNGVLYVSTSFGPGHHVRFATCAGRSSRWWRRCSGTAHVRVMGSSTLSPFSRIFGTRKRQGTDWQQCATWGTFNLCVPSLRGWKAGGEGHCTYTHLCLTLKPSSDHRAVFRSFEICSTARCTVYAYPHSVNGCNVTLRRSPRRGSNSADLFDCLQSCRLDSTVSFLQPPRQSSGTNESRKTCLSQVRLRGGDKVSCAVCTWQWVATRTAPKDKGVPPGLGRRCPSWTRFKRVLNLCTWRRQRRVH